MGAAVGDGPVDTLSGALRDALLPLHPFLGKLKLTDYRVRVLNPEKATAATRARLHHDLGRRRNLGHGRAWTRTSSRHRGRR